MKSRNIVCIATIAALGFGTAAQAQQWRGEAQGPHQQQQWRGQHQAPAQVQEHQQRWAQRQQWQAPAYQQRYVQPQYNYQRQYQPQPQYHAYNNYAPRYYGGGYANYAPRYYGHGGHYGGSRYYVGGYAPVYASHRYWINDWRARHLYAPPYGYQWVETDTGDVLLLALATGLIANAILAQ
jgi:Ni/Co efflux regulator RcnB